MGAKFKLRLVTITLIATTEYQWALCGFVSTHQVTVDL